jgi:hypothetical protein
VCWLVLGTRKHDEAGSATCALDDVHDDDVMCMIVCFMRFKLQCICNELIYVQKKMQGSQPFLSWVFTGRSPLNNGRIS